MDIKFMCSLQQIRLLLLAVSICWGTGAAADYIKAKHFFDKEDYKSALIEANQSAAQGDANSLNLLGIMYQNGMGVEKSLSKAISIFEKAIKQKSGKALLNLGQIYSSEKYGLMDKKKAESLLLLAINTKDRMISNEASFNLGLMYYFDDTFSENELKAVKYLTLAADNTHIDATKALGHIAETQASAFFWYEKASRFGDPEAEYLAGEMLFWGNGTKKNVQRAIRLLTKSASNKFLRANEFLGEIYGFNYLSENDYTKAISYLRNATNQGSITAKINLGTLYRTLAQYQKSFAILTQAVDFLDSQTPKNFNLLAHATKALATTQFEMGKYKAAEIDFMKSISIAEKLYGDNNAKLTSYYSDVAAFYGKISVRDLAQKFFKKALKVVDEKNDFTNYFAISNNYSIFLADNGQNHDAIESLESLADKLRIKLGNYTQKLSPVLYNLGNQYQIIGEAKKARQNYKKALEINLRHYGELHDDNSRIYMGLAGIYEIEEDYANALMAYQKSMKIMENVYNGEHPELLRLILKISQIESVENQEKNEVRTLLEFTEQLIKLRKFGRFNLISSDSDYAFDDALYRLTNLLFQTGSSSQASKLF